MSDQYNPIEMVLALYKERQNSQPVPVNLHLLDIKRNDGPVHRAFEFRQDGEPIAWCTVHNIGSGRLPEESKELGAFASNDLGFITALYLHNMGYFQSKKFMTPCDILTHLRNSFMTMNGRQLQFDNRIGQDQFKAADYWHIAAVLDVCIRIETRVLGVGTITRSYGVNLKIVSNLGLVLDLEPARPLNPVVWVGNGVTGHFLVPGLNS